MSLAEINELSSKKVGMVNGLVEESFQKEQTLCWKSNHQITSL